jgi:hypothetical protein
VHFARKSAKINMLARLTRRMFMEVRRKNLNVIAVRALMPAKVL